MQVEGEVAGRPRHERIARDRHRDAKVVLRTWVRGRERLLLAPGRARAHEDVCRAIAGQCHSEGRRPDHDRVPGDRHRVAEEAEFKGVRRYELLLLVPGRSRAHEHVRRTCIGIALRVLSVRSDDHGIPGDRHRVAEPIVCRPIRCQELLLLAPSRARADEHIRRARILASRGVIPPRPDHDCVRCIRRDRHRPSELVAPPSVGCQELLLLAPGRARAYEHVRRARIPTARRVIPVRPDHHRIPGERHRRSELVARPSVRCQEFLLLAPGRARAHEDVRRACIHAGRGVIPVRPDHDRVPRNGHLEAEFVAGRSVRRHELLLHVPGRPRAHEYIRRACVSTCCGFVPGRPDHDRVPGDRHRGADSGFRMADGLPFAEELSLVDERGVDGDREASGLRLHDEPDVVGQRLQARPQRAPFRVPGP